MKIQDIIDKFDKEFIYQTIGGIYSWKATSLTRGTDVRNFIQSSLTSLLDSVKTDIEKTKEEVKKQTGSYKYDDQYDDCINIINSYK